MCWRQQRVRGARRHRGRDGRNAQYRPRQGGVLRCERSFHRRSFSLLADQLLHGLEHAAAGWVVRVEDPGRVAIGTREDAGVFRGAGAVGQAAVYAVRGDLNRDDQVNITDFGLFVNVFGIVCPRTSSAPGAVHNRLLIGRGYEPGLSAWHRVRSNYFLPRRSTCSSSIGNHGRTKECGWIGRRAGALGHQLGSHRSSSMGGVALRGCVPGGPARRCASAPEAAASSAGPADHRVPSACCGCLARGWGLEGSGCRSLRVPGCLSVRAHLATPRSHPQCVARTSHRPDRFGTEGRWDRTRSAQDNGCPRNIHSIGPGDRWAKPGLMTL